MVKKLPELLAPAKNAVYGRAAIDHGADAVYIGASRFSARKAAVNTVDDIADLASYAHMYRCHVYAAVNTVLFDGELDDAKNLVYDLYQAGADAIIIQDTALLSMELPPIQIHASTQMHNINAERIRFLEQAGISRVILARELSIEEIRRIRETTKLELEVFVHGALCVSYSGQCYMSCAAGGRSANRGECAQPCRKAYSLVDSRGRGIIENSHLLSLKDMRRDMHLAELVAAGVTGFKIEGRLKDLSYVKNVTAHYRKKLDELIASDNTLSRSSSGTAEIMFKPDPEKSFNRGFTDYFRICLRKGACPSAVIGPDTLLAGTSKSIGKRIGRVLSIKGDIISMRSEPDTVLSAGDGMCFFDNHGMLHGFRIESAAVDKYRVSDPSHLYAGAELYRNHDQVFEKTLSGKSAERKIPVSVELCETSGTLEVLITDDEGTAVRVPVAAQPSAARDRDRALSTIREALSKLGDTPLRAENVMVSCDNIPFFPVSALNEARRKAADELLKQRMLSYRRGTGGKTQFDDPYPEGKLDYHGNVTNKLARQFYSDHGCHADDGFELLPDHNGLEVMTTKMCLKREKGWCTQGGREVPGSEPLFLEDDTCRYRLEFDCKNCVMRIIYIGRIK